MAEKENKESMILEEEGNNDLEGGELLYVKDVPPIKYTLDNFEFNDNKLSEKGITDLDKLKIEIEGAKK